MVQEFRRVAKKYGIHRVADTAGKDGVLAMVDAILAAPTLSDEDRAMVCTTRVGYEATWTVSSTEPLAQSFAGALAVGRPELPK